MLVLLLGLAGGVAVFVFPDQVAQYLPALSQATATPATRTYVSKGVFELKNQEIIVPAGVDVRQAFLDTFIEVARSDPRFGPEAIINPNAPPAFIGQPEKIADEAGGARYRATMQGLVLAPQ